MADPGYAMWICMVTSMVVSDLTTRISRMDTSMVTWVNAMITQAICLVDQGHLGNLV